MLLNKIYNSKLVLKSIQLYYLNYNLIIVKIKIVR